ncbi:MAG: precorrin-2 C(20)-methyltransferase [Pseudomonadota bacterium]
MTGTLYGIGLGPGDPELMTLRAHRLIGSLGVIAYPAPAGGESFARSIAAETIRDDATEIEIAVPMRTERFPAQDIYDSAARDIAQHLTGGKDVGLLCEGDPFFYGSFMYVFARLATDFPVEVVPGITSLTACAAAAGRPLSARNESLAVIPAPAGRQRLDAAIAANDAIAIIKVGRHLPVVRDAIEAAGRTSRAVYISHATLSHQVVCPLAEAPEAPPYFSMVLIGGTDRFAHE